MDIEEKGLQSTATVRKAVVPAMTIMECEEAELGCTVVEVKVNQAFSKSTVNKLEYENESERTAGEIKAEEKASSLSLKNEAKCDLEPTRKGTEGMECDQEALNPKMNEVQGTQMELDSSIAEIEDGQADSEDGEGDLSDSFTDYSDKETSTSEGGDQLNYEVPLTDHEIEELIAELLETESKAAEAQETLEKESLARVENEVRSELAENLQGDDLDMAVEEEMKTFVEQWEEVLDDLETESALLLEQLDGAGVDLPGLFKWIERQAPEGCSTEAWRKRIHWAGSQMTNEVREAISGAENYLQESRPVKKRHGKVLEEGASGFLAKILKIEDDKEGMKDNLGNDWDCVNELFQPQGSAEGASFGSAHWTSVYLASTPQEAANMGLKLPGVNEVEEIDDIDSCSGNPFYDAAVAGEKETGFTDEQKKNFRKIVEEDDLNIARELQVRLKQKRHRNLRKKQQSVELNKLGLEADSAYNFKSGVSGDLGAMGELTGKGMKSCSASTDLGNSSSPVIYVNGSWKHPRVDEHKDEKDQMVIIDSDDDIGFNKENVSVHVALSRSC